MYQRKSFPRYNFKWLISSWKPPLVPELWTDPPILMEWKLSWIFPLFTIQSKSHTFHPVYQLSEMFLAAKSSRGDKIEPKGYMWFGNGIWFGSWKGIMQFDGRPAGPYSVTLTLIERVCKLHDNWIRRSHQWACRPGGTHQGEGVWHRFLATLIKMPSVLSVSLIISVVRIVFHRNSLERVWEPSN